MPIHSDTSDSWDALNDEMEMLMAENDAYHNGRHIDMTTIHDAQTDTQIWNVARNLWDVLMDNGGFSFKPVYSTPTYGYMVGDGKSELRVRTCTYETLYRFLYDNWTRVFDSENLYFGGWVDEYVYLDVSEWYSDKSIAISAAAINNEKAIFDLINGETIYL